MTILQRAEARSKKRMDKCSRQSYLRSLAHRREEAHLAGTLAISLHLSIT
jgi:hypothetical protein